MVWHIPGIRMPLSVVVPDSAAATNKAPERGHWGSKAEFVLSCVGMSVGMGNVWRFPYQAYNNGGAAFLFPYLLLLFLVGKPMYYAECILGQFSSLGPVTVYKFCPPLKGVGISASIISLFVAFYYNMFMVYSLIYFVFCFSPTLPWSECSEWWDADYNCYIRGQGITPCSAKKPVVREMIQKALKQSLETSNTTGSLGLVNLSTPCIEWESAGTQFWTRYILHLTPETNIANVGDIQWKVAIALIVSWLIIFLCIGRGIKTSGKVVYVTAIFPYIVLLILFIMGLTLEGSGHGLNYLFIPDWQQLASPQIWTAAASQMFFSLNVAYGGVIMFSSYNQFQNKVKTDAMIVTTMDTLTSVVASVAIFSILGNMASTLNLDIKKNADELVKSGPGMAFEVVPEALLNLGIPHLWCALFMLMLITLAIDSEFAYVETFLTGLYDEVPLLRRHKVLTCGCVCLACCIIGLSFTTQGGMYVLEFIDVFCAGNSALFVAIFEMIAIFWIYGLRNFLDDAEFMLGKRPGYYWRVCWTIIDPIILIVIFIFAMYGWGQLVQFRGEPYPGWAIGLGVILTILSVIAIPIFVVYYLVRYKLKGIKLRSAFTPTEDWGPADSYMRGVYKDWKAKEPRPGTQKRSLPNFEGLVAAPEVLQPTESMATYI